MDDTDDSLTDPDQYMESYRYFAVASESIEQDSFEIEMTKALEEIFYNLRQLRESRYELEKKRLLNMNMDDEQELENASCHELDEETEDIEVEKETGLEKQDTDKGAPLEESRTELNRRLRMETERSELEEVTEVAQYVRVGPYSEEVRSETDAEQLRESRSENRRWSVKAEKNDLSDKSLHHGEQTAENVNENIREIETARSDQQGTRVDDAQVKEDGFELNRRMQVALGDDSFFQRDIEAKNEGNNPGNEATPEKQDQAAIIQDKSHFPRRRQLPLLPTVKKSSYSY